MAKSAKNKPSVKQTLKMARLQKPVSIPKYPSTAPGRKPSKSTKMK